jgi:superfamily II DNA or RNA helicase
MMWDLHPGVSLRNERVPDADADRQQHTAVEILRRLEHQPGIVLADEVGMGKTFVALAVAVSAIQATRKRRPVVVMVPAGVADKWPREWAVFAERCLPPGHGLRASDPVRRGSDFLKLLDDDAATRKHLIFLTHGALTQSLNDPFIRLALMRRALFRRKTLAPQRRAVARFAGPLLGDHRFSEVLTEELLASPVARWREIWNGHRPNNWLEDDPVPFSLDQAASRADLASLREALQTVPLRQSAGFKARVAHARGELRQALQEVWKGSLRELDVRLPLLVLDEAHHVKNPNQLAGLFANPDADADLEVQGPLGGMFDRMLFLTATPFQLGHHELLSVLDRFHGVRWPTARARQHFDHQLEQLRVALDGAQSAALRLERAWGRIDTADSDLVAALQSFDVHPDQPEAVQTALSVAREVETSIQAAEHDLRTWVIRHTKGTKESRRRSLDGEAILQGEPLTGPVVGLPITGAATLPFLLAARAQAIASLGGSGDERAARSLFAYGLASSFEAYVDTRRNRVAAVDDLDDGTEITPISPQLQWYLERISAALPTDGEDGWGTHPKIAAVVDRVLALWLQGEKAVVFCFYVETGRALRTHISRALRSKIVQLGADALGLNPDDEDAVLDQIGRVSDRLLRSGSPGHQRLHDEVVNLTAHLGPELSEQIAEIAIRFMRTPSFIVRSVPLGPKVSADDLMVGFRWKDLSGRSLADKVIDLAKAIEQQVDSERHDLFDALTGIQTGGIAATAEDFDAAERASSREVLLPNVRLANGGVRRETRERLMLAFNTPFFPEVLVASSVMAEGVDLHQDCRHVIHHDLDWNPSTLEQRTGRLDRIGSKATRCQEPVVIYEPFLAGTHDEKMYRVVKDRERWFGVVMGENTALDERATELRAERVPLPAALARRLTMNLGLDPQP